MKLNPQKTSTPQQISKPNPPTMEMVEKAQFVDKTYHWKYADLRSGNGRTTK